MQKLPETPDRKRGGACTQKKKKKNNKKKTEPSRQKKEALYLSAVTSGVITPKSFLLQVEGTMSSSLDDELANLSTSSSRLFKQRSTTKNTK